MTFHDLSDIGVEGEGREKTKNKQKNHEQTKKREKRRNLI